MKINITDIINRACPDLVIGVLEAEVVNRDTSDELWSILIEESEKIKSSIKLEEINQRPEILSTRLAYKKLGKDPNRYRPSAEALCRRIVREIPIYRLNTLVDIINIVSIRSGYSIGAFDTDKIMGDLKLDVGNNEDQFEAIGRGFMNIEGLPVYRDNEGGIGTPTSDCERTKITLNTTSMLIIINAFSGNMNLQSSMNFCIELLTKYAQAKNIRVNNS
jgi:DNA/RNA-binding domain of Phe-tRNA-synthetase-like protein